MYVKLSRSQCEAIMSLLGAIEINDIPVDPADQQLTDSCSRISRIMSRIRKTVAMNDSFEQIRILHSETDQSYCSKIGVQIRTLDLDVDMCTTCKHFIMNGGECDPL